MTIRELDDGTRTAQEIADALGISKAAVHKHWHRQRNQETA